MGTKKLSKELQVLNQDFNSLSDEENPFSGWINYKNKNLRRSRKYCETRAGLLRVSLIWWPIDGCWIDGTFGSGG